MPNPAVAGIAVSIRSQPGRELFAPEALFHVLSGGLGVHVQRRLVHKAFLQVRQGGLGLQVQRCRFLDSYSRRHRITGVDLAVRCPAPLGCQRNPVTNAQTL